MFCLFLIKKQNVGACKNHLSEAILTITYDLFSAKKGAINTPEIHIFHHIVGLLGCSLHGLGI